MKTKTLSYTPILFCILILYGVPVKTMPMPPCGFTTANTKCPWDGRRYLGLESGNGDYSLGSRKITRIASAGI